MTINSDSTHQKWINFAFIVTGSIFLQSYCVSDNVSGSSPCRFVCYFEFSFWKARTYFKYEKYKPNCHAIVLLRWFQLFLHVFPFFIERAQIYHQILITRILAIVPLSENPLICYLNILIKLVIPNCWNTCIWAHHLELLE